MEGWIETMQKWMLWIGLICAGIAAAPCWGQVNNPPFWIQESPANMPPARFGAAMAYDAAHGVAVLFGGEDDSSNRFSDTWLWDGANWTQVQYRRVRLRRADR